MRCFLFNSLNQRKTNKNREDYLSTESSPSLPATAFERQPSNETSHHWSVGSSSQFRNSAGYISSRSTSNTNTRTPGAGSRLGGLSVDLPLPTSRTSGESFARMSDRSTTRGPVKTPSTAPAGRADRDYDSSDGSGLVFVSRSAGYEGGRFGQGMLGPGAEGAGGKPFGRRYTDPATSSSSSRRQSPMDPPPSPPPTGLPSLLTPMSAPNAVGDGRDDSSDDTPPDAPATTPANLGRLHPDQLVGVEAAGSVPFGRRPPRRSRTRSDSISQDPPGSVGTDDSNPYVRRTSRGGVSSQFGPAGSRSQSDAGSGSAPLDMSRLELPARARKGQDKGQHARRPSRGARGRGDGGALETSSRSHCSGTGSGSGSMKQSISVGGASSSTSVSSAVTSKMSGSRSSARKDDNTNESSKRSKKSEFLGMQMCMVCDGGSDGSSDSSPSLTSGASTKSAGVGDDDGSSSAGRSAARTNSMRSNFTPETDSGSHASPRTEDGSAADRDPPLSFGSSRSGVRYGSYDSGSNVTRSESGSSVFAC